MSAFLGPIHFRVYGKVQIQERLTQRAAEFAVSQGWVQAESAEDFVRVDERPLDEIIDLSNIHGWLLAQINDAEGRYAKLLTLILRGESERLDALLEIAFRVGAEYAIEDDLQAFGLFRELEGRLLDGMPCDGGCMVTDKSEENFTWEHRVDLHRPFWDACGGDVENYHAMRRELVRGFLSKSDKEIVTEDGVSYRFAVK